MTQSSMMTLEVEDARIPNLSSFLPKDNPGASLGTIKALIPLCFLLLSVVAKTTKQPAEKSQSLKKVVLFVQFYPICPILSHLSSPWCALVIQALVPFTIQLSPSSLATVEAAPASLPFPGSVKQNAPTLSPLT